MTKSAISIQQVSKSFRDTRAVSALDLEVPAGSLCGFLGPNGAGKSTTIRMIMSIIQPDSGQIRVLDGNALQSKDRIGYLPEERGLYRKMRVGEFLTYVARLKGRSRAGLQRDIRSWLERIELPDAYSRRCQELSKGMQQKVQFLAAIIHGPELLILDEPFSGLDPVNSKLLNGLVRALHEEGRTVVFSTHILHQAEALCDRIFLINHGVKLLDASLAEIRARFDPRTILCEPMGPSNGLANIPGVTAVLPIPDSPAVELEIAPGSDPQAIMRAAMQLAEIRSIELRQPTLDEVFVRLVLADEGREAARRARETLQNV